MSLPTIYCINMESSKDRRARMEKRFKFFNLTDKVVYIKAVDRSKPIIEYYHMEVEKLAKHSEHLWISEMACFASHLKAIRTFLEEGGEECIICEDDIILKNDFVKEYEKARKDFRPAGTREGVNQAPFIVALSHMVESWEGSKTIKGSLRSVNVKKLWGTQMYWLTKEYAMHCLDEYDKPYKYLKPNEPAGERYHTSELIVREEYETGKGALVIKPPLCIEEGCESERKQEDMPYHHNLFMQWGYNNYADCEQGVHVSPMADPNYRPNI